MIDYDGRRFRAESGAVATYRQRGDLVWAEFGGGETRRGALCGVCASDGTLEFAYSMVLTTGEVVAGRCVSTPRVLDGGRIRLTERWERYGPNAASGLSELEELDGGPEAGG